MQKILTLLLSFPVFGMKVGNRLSSEEAWMTVETTSFTKEDYRTIQELEEYLLTEPIDYMRISRIFRDCTDKPSDLSRPILEKALLRESSYWIVEQIFDYCITQRIHLSPETLNEALLKASGFLMVQKILEYCITHDIHLGAETLNGFLLRPLSDFCTLKQILDYCTMKEISLSQEILEEILSKQLPAWVFQEIFDYLTKRKIILSQAILENLILRADEWILPKIFRYCQNSQIVLLENTLENSPLRLSHYWKPYEIFQYFKESGIILSQAILRNLIQNSQPQIHAEIPNCIIQTNLIVSEDAIWDLINDPELRINHRAMLGYLERLNMHPGVQNHLRAVLGNEEINNTPDESIIQINVASYKNDSLAMLSTHFTKNQKPNTTQHLMKCFEAHIAKLPKTIRSIEEIRKKIETLSGAEMGRLATLHVENPYWIEGNLSPEEIQARWTVFFNSFISGVGFANYKGISDTNTTSCSPDRACVEALASLKEPLAMLAILRQRNAGPLTEEISVSHPNGEVDAVFEMGINRAVIAVLEQLLQDSSRIDFSVSEEENIRILETGHLRVIRPQKTCNDNMRVLGAFSAEWTRKTYDKPIDFEYPNNEKWKAMRRDLARAIYQVLRYKQFNPSVSYDAVWFKRHIELKDKGMAEYASAVAVKLKELKKQNMIPLESLEQLYCEVVQDQFRMPETMTVAEKLREGQRIQMALTGIFQEIVLERKPELKQAPEIKTESEEVEEEGLPGFLQSVHRALLDENKEGYTKEQVIDALVKRDISHEDAEGAVKQYENLLFLSETK